MWNINALSQIEIGDDGDDDNDNFTDPLVDFSPECGFGFQTWNSHWVR